MHEQQSLLACTQTQRGRCLAKSVDCQRVASFASHTLIGCNHNAQPRPSHITWRQWRKPDAAPVPLWHSPTLRTLLMLTNRGSRWFARDVCFMFQLFKISFSSFCVFHEHTHTYTYLRHDTTGVRPKESQKNANGIPRQKFCGIPLN